MIAKKQVIAKKKKKKRKKGGWGRFSKGYYKDSSYTVNINEKL